MTKNLSFVKQSVFFLSNHKEVVNKSCKLFLLPISYLPTSTFICHCFQNSRHKNENMKPVICHPFFKLQNVIIEL